MKIVFSLIAVALITPALADDFAPLALNGLSVAPAKITAAQVLDQNGAVVGTVHTIVTDQNGKPAALSYLASDNRLRVIGAAGVSYDAQRNIVVADTSQAKMANQLAVN